MKPRISYDHQIRLPIGALVIKAILAFITGKFETLGSNFSHETACSDPKKLDFFETT